MNILDIVLIFIGVCLIGFGILIQSEKALLELGLKILFFLGFYCIFYAFLTSGIISFNF